MVANKDKNVNVIEIQQNQITENFENGIAKRSKFVAKLFCH